MCRPGPLCLAAPFIFLLCPAAQADPAGMQQLRAALLAGRADALEVTWTQGLPGTEQQRLQIRGGKAQLSRCAPSGPCSDPGAPLVLTAGQRERLLSGLRAAGLQDLRSAGPADEKSADRALVVVAEGARAGQWQLPRQAWPAPAGGDSDGLAAFLDELALRLRRAQAARPPVPIPRTAQDLMQLTLKLRVTPRARPGGVLVVEHGVAHITPEEGTEARVPRPGPWQHQLDAGEVDQLLQAIQAADWEKLEAEVPRREAAAIGDSDGRLCTLHLLPVLDEGAPAGQAGDKVAYEPRGLSRFVADLQRSPAAPLIDQLLRMLTTPPPRARGSRPPAR